MGLTERDAAIVQDELRDRGAAVGTPSELGGVPYDELGVTGYGIAEATDAVVPLAGQRVAIQGFGAVGRAAARRYAELGATVVAVSSALVAVYDPAAIYAAISTKLRANAVTVLDAASATSATPHQAARALAETRVRTAMHLRGRTPASPA